MQLTIGSASVLSDVFTIEWGLRKLVFKECDLDELVRPPAFYSIVELNLTSRSLNLFSMHCSYPALSPSSRLHPTDA